MSDAQHVNFNPQVILLRFNQRMERISRGVVLSIAGLHELQDRDDVGNLPGVFVMTGFGNAGLSSPVARRAAQSWVLGEGLRAAHDALAVHCEELFRILVIAERQREGPVKVPPGRHDVLAVAETLGPKTIAEFDRRGLAGKLHALEHRFGLSTSVLPQLESINQARNCLTHRLGLVGERDVTDKASDELVVSYRRLSLDITPPDGDAMEVQPGVVYEKGGSLALNLTKIDERRFRKGSTVEFSAQEFMHLLMTFMIAANTLMQQTLRYCAGPEAEGPSGSAAGEEDK